MSFGSIRTELLLNTAIEELHALAKGDFTASVFPKTLALISVDYPQLGEAQKISLLKLVLDAYMSGEGDQVELVATAPVSFSLKTKRTQDVAHKILRAAKQSIFITGYSISDFIAEFIDEIVAKSQKGVFVKIFINDLDKQTAIEKLLRYQSKFLQIYNYTNEEDKMAALHAKVISVDGSVSLISSANLSYHGMSGNIEIGSLIQSKRIAGQINELFTQLIFQKVFKSISNL